MSGQTRYPSFNVLDEKEEWDDHTRKIVTSRIGSVIKFQFLTKQEVDILRSVCSLLVDDSSPDALALVVSHIDHQLYSSPGEGQRKAGVPAASELIRQGLSAIDQAAQHKYSSSFSQLDAAGQKQLLRDISAGKAVPAEVWNGIPQKELFDKLMRFTVESYCSHPRVWSDIGYAGPAYPRGYVRAQLGQLDPWEAKAEHEA
ncbi:Gluconate 2-dehydrogenase subunit 3 [Paenibacillus sp. UNCCL117]|uniref:gluconate 2-dehydrogenase subunit 3 family protein n=1 Tax=unclassified Paenibacillus TaxID=185978 RepID=UPI0008841E20|nr:MULTISPECIES: gluconate 2-dehydrogenase subunit 3 family protein [unclassified Paenibacillus]SDD49211.1 Gluconate 2-dehydrogenase subunit 3 [Paenibacillus sp. cl123]SFW50041.1 Gluconate 2-dehydrogenase subunit 3 [Paenibacillus sp. UNCCL117]